MTRQPVIAHGAPIHGSQNLPVRPPEKLIGREADLDSANLALKAGTAVLLYGFSGVGKTVLASTLAAGYAELPGGVLWLDLFDDTFGALANRVARAFGVAPVADPESSEIDIDPITALLQEHRPLVVLDGGVNADVVREFVRRCTPGVPLVFTQSRLVAGAWTPHEVSPLPQTEARALMTALGVDLAALDDEDTEQMLAKLGGNPLAVHIAARQLAGGTTWGDLLGKMPTLPPGPTNRVMAVMMAAYRLLPHELQAMVMLIGTAFTGRASEELLSDVTGAESEIISGRMRQLVERGLVMERRVYDRPFYVAHELTQQFAHAFLRGKRRLDTMRARHLHGLTVFVQRHADEADDAHYRALALEMDNLLAAGRYAATQGKAEFLSDMGRLLAVDGDDSFGRALGFEPELRWLRDLVDFPEVALHGLLAPLAPLPPEPEPEPVEAAMAEEVPPAESPPEPEASPETPPEAEPETLSEAPATEAVAEETPSPEPASADVRIPDEVAAAPQMPAEATGSPAGPVALPVDAESLEALARQAREQGNPEEAITQYNEALQSFKADGNVEDELAAIEALAMLSLESEKYEDVLAYVDQGMKLAEESDNPQREGRLLMVLGDLQLELGRFEGAEAAYREAVNAFRPTEAWLDIGLALDKLASVYWEMKRPQDAVDVWEQTVPIYERVGRQDLVRDALEKVGDTCADLLDWDRAQKTYERLVEMARAQSDPRSEYEHLFRLGALSEARGEREKAIVYYRRALHLVFGLEDREELADTLLALARLLIDDTVHLHRALQLLEAADRFRPEDTEIKRLLGRAKTRQERLMRAGVTLPLVDDSLQEYARRAYEEALT